MEDREKDWERKGSGKCPKTDHGYKKTSKKINACLHMMRGQSEAMANPDPSSAPSPRISSPVRQVIGGMLEKMPNSKAGLLSYAVHWVIYDTNENLREEMRAFIAETTNEFLGPTNLGGRGTFVNHLVNFIGDHEPAIDLLEYLKFMFENLGEENKVENFFLEIWQEMIFRIRRIQENQA